MIKADDMSRKDPEQFKAFPKTMPVHRPDEVKAARDLNTNYFLNKASKSSSRARETVSR